VRGNSSSWIYSEYRWTWYFVVKNESTTDYLNQVKEDSISNPFPDSIYLKFRFISDSTEESREGWMIDDISINDEICYQLNELNSELNVDIFPNPTHEHINFHLFGSPSFSRYCLYSPVGSKIIEKEINGNNLSLNISGLNKGLYIIRLETIENNILIKKFVVL
jgi:hypothetical protein